MLTHQLLKSINDSRTHLCIVVPPDDFKNLVGLKALELIFKFRGSNLHIGFSNESQICFEAYFSETPDSLIAHIEQIDPNNLQTIPFDAEFANYLKETVLHIISRIFSLNFLGYDTPQNISNISKLKEDIEKYIKN